MTLAMAAVGDLVSPRERARYQGYIATTFAAATVVGPLVGGALVEHASWRWVFYVNVPVGLFALAGLHLRLPAPETRRPEHALDIRGAVLLASATTGLMLACIWGGDRFGWGSPTLLSLIAVTALLGVALVVRERRVADPIVPLDLLRTRTVAVASASLFLTTASLFAVTVFVPLFLQTTTGATPTQAGLLMIATTLGLTVSTNVAGRIIGRTGRYKRFPVAGLALMTIALVMLAVAAGDPSRTTVAMCLAVFGLGFGLVGQVLTVAVQNGVEQRQLGVAMATTSFFRALGGAIGAAVLGAIFAAQTGRGANGAGAIPRADIIDAVQAVFVVAAPIAALALIIVLALKEVPLRGRAGAPRDAAAPHPARPAAPAAAR
jgi:MFS family permease